jgi:organic radical activating enzyme
MKDKLGPALCLAKWKQVSLHLPTGLNNSCYHPPLHAIDPVAVAANPAALHNTEYKKAQRKIMLQQERPAECSYCWNMEDQGKLSDRHYRSGEPWAAVDFETIKNSTGDEDDVIPSYVEVNFNNACNLKCSYCSPQFSSSWGDEVHRNGAYPTAIPHNAPEHFSGARRVIPAREHNPYVEAFFKWWETDLHRTLQELRITGGEPLMSGETWKLIDWFKTNKNKSSTRLAINSNLGMDRIKLQEFIERVQDIPHLEIYTSMESVDQQAEYIRDGLDYDLWMHNVQELLEHDHIKAVHCMCTINALCLEQLPDLLYQLLKLKQVYGRERVNFTLNILRFPSFQSALVLPDHIRTGYRVVLEEWLYRNRGNPCLHEHEINHTQRLIDYLDVVKTPHSDTFEMPKLLNDFKQFYTQYDQRRGKDFVTAFPELKEWYNTL